MIKEICTECKTKEDWDKLLFNLEENTAVKWGSFDWHVDEEAIPTDDYSYKPNMLFFGWNGETCLLRGNSFDIGDADMVDSEEFSRRVLDVVGPK